MENFEKGFYEVKDKIFYHLFSYKKIAAGEVIEAGKQKNGMWKRVYQKDFTINGESTHDLISKAIKRKFGFLHAAKLVGKKKLDGLRTVINDYDFAMRELALEEVRAKNFKNYPSRFTCIFVVNSEEEALNWTPRLLWQRPNCQLVRLKCTGKIFIGDSKFNKKDNYCFEKSLEIANGYWSDNLSEKPQLEVLFEGKAEVTEVIKELN